MLLAPAAVLTLAFVLTGTGSWGPAAADTPSDVAPCTSPPPSPVPVASPSLAIQVNDYGSFYDPSLPTVRRGTTVVWTLVRTKQHHTVTDTTGMQLFDSGSLNSGDSCSYTFTAAGDYDYYCVFHTDMTGRIHVPLWVGPPTGSRATTFQLVWDSVAPAAGYAFDVKVRRPGGTTWRLLRSATSARSGAFVPHWGVGSYRFEARLRQVATGETSGWSPPALITVR